MKETVNVFPFKIDRRLCKKCGLCIASCPTKVYTASQDGAPQVTNPEKCTRCNLCFFRCPDFAIQLEVSE